MSPPCTASTSRAAPNVSPEFFALLLGLVTYTAGYIAEIVRAGHSAVAWGQSEAAGALGMNAGRSAPHRLAAGAAGDHSRR